MLDVGTLAREAQGEALEGDWNMYLDGPDGFFKAKSEYYNNNNNNIHTTVFPHFLAME